MNKITYTLLISSALALSACGGSGNGNQPNNQNHHNHDNGLNGDSKPKVTNKKIQGIYTLGTSSRKPYGGDDLSTIIVNGNKVSLTIPNFFVSGLTSLSGANISGKSYNEFHVSGSKYNDSKFGFIVNESTDNKGVAFTQGLLTKDMPATDKVNYQGHSIFFDTNTKKVSTGTSDIMVDFANNQLHAVLKNKPGKNRYELSFDADITGNLFKESNGASVYASGYFYGQNAAEVGGVFDAKDGNFKGAFGAVKD